MYVFVFVCVCVYTYIHTHTYMYIWRTVGQRTGILTGGTRQGRDINAGRDFKASDSDTVSTQSLFGQEGGGDFQTRYQSIRPSPEPYAGPRTHRISRQPVPYSGNDATVC